MGISRKGKLCFLDVSPAMNKIMAVVYGTKVRASVQGGQREEFESIGLGQDIVRALKLKDGDEVSVSVSRIKKG